MTDIVDPNKIEEIVGHRRMSVVHLGRAVSSEGIFYILHSQRCVDRYPDLRDCPYSQLLDTNEPVIQTEDAVQTLYVDHKNKRLVAKDFAMIEAAPATFSRYATQLGRY